MSKSRIRASALILCLLLTAPLPFRWALAQDEVQNGVKTAFVYQFTRYIEWSNAKEKKEFVILLTGDSALMEPLRELAKKKMVGDIPIVVEKSEIGGKLRSASMVIIADAADGKKVVEAVKGANVLTISHGEGLAAQGVVVNFYLEDGKLRFEINRRAAQEHGLTVSSQLFKLARVVE